MKITKAYAAENSSSKLTPFSFKRRDVGENDVAIDIAFCGVCHSDLHQVKNDWGFSQYPMVPGHEIVGKVVEVGNKVTNFKVGQHVGVGCLVDSCQACPSCEKDEEQFCHNGSTQTYNSEDKKSGGHTYGGYSNYMVVDKNFVLSVDESFDLAKAAPLLCAGITTYSPLKKHLTQEKNNVAIAGFGGLGHMAVKIAKAMGAKVSVLTHSASKVDMIKKLGVDDVIIMSDKNATKACENSFDLILDTISAEHDLNAYFSLLKQDGTLCQVGLPSQNIPVSIFPFVFKRISLTGSLIGGIKETQEMLDFCAKHQITADVEIVAMDKINDVFAQLAKGDAKNRYVIDMSSL